MLKIVNKKPGKLIINYRIDKIQKRKNSSKVFIATTAIVFLLYFILKNINILISLSIPACVLIYYFVVFFKEGNNTVIDTHKETVFHNGWSKPVKAFESIYIRPTWENPPKTPMYCLEIVTADSMDDVSSWVDEISKISANITADQSSEEKQTALKQLREIQDKINLNTLKIAMHNTGSLIREAAIILAEKTNLKIIDHFDKLPLKEKLASQGLVIYPKDNSGLFFLEIISGIGEAIT